MPMLEDKNGVRFFEWELNRAEVDRRYGNDFSDDGVESYDYALRRMRWLRGTVQGPFSEY
ncbi:hypothetical protein [Kitasatospora sp. NPDC001132]